MKRILALVGAVAMVVVSLSVRATVIDDDPPGEGLTIACVPELEAICHRLSGAKVVIQEPAATMTEIATADPAVDGWMTFEPWPAIAAASARRELTGAPVRVASTALTIAMARERAAALAAHCRGGSVDWRCLIDAVDQSWEALGGKPEWGAVKVGLPARSTALGGLVTGAAVSGYLGRSDFATNDLDADDGFSAWFAKLRASGRSGDPFAEFVQRFPASYSAASATAADIATGLGTRASRVEVVVPMPAIRVIAVLAPVGEQRARAVADLATGERLHDAFADAGWQPAPRATDSTGLPDPGVLLALGQR